MIEAQTADYAIKLESADILEDTQAEPQAPKAGKSKNKGSRPSTRKTIKAPGSSGTRTAQACDRCRAKKSRCDGKQPACSSCAAAGMECIVSDRLTRKSYPKGYTELLEEQSRRLLAENARLKGALDIRDAQLASYAESGNKEGLQAGQADFRGSGDVSAQKMDASPDLSNPHSVLHTHTHEEGCPCCQNSPAVHERPVSVAGPVFNGGIDDSSIQGSVYSDFDDDFDDDYDMASTISGESYQSQPEELQGNSHHPQTLQNGQNDLYNKQIRPAPGAFAAATAIEQMQNKRNHQGQKLNEQSKEQMLTSLVAASIPRSTEETLFIPTLLARVCEAYGYSSTPAKLTASAIASLKEKLTTPSILAGKKMGHSELLALIFNNDVAQLDHNDALRFLQQLRLPSKTELDHLLKVYFQNWGNVMPIINRNAFLKNYVRFSDILDNGYSTRVPEYCYESTEKLGALVVLVVSLALLSKKFTYTESDTATADIKWADYSALLVHFDALIHEFIKPNCVLTKVCSLQSLQILALALQYCLASGDFITCYELRGRVITMAQQLRLHRCPAAVLGLSKEMNDRNLKAFMQGERRIVFWCIYVLDVYSSLNLGVPRLLKDYEIECATPFSGKTDDDNDERDNENILIVNNTKLTIFGKVTRISLCLMQFCKVLGNIMDTIFSRSGNYNVHEKALEKDQMLDCWRRDLPADLKFDTDVDGFSLADQTPQSDQDLARGSPTGSGTGSEGCVRQKYLLVYLYYHAKILIYLPIISKYGYHHNVGMSMKEKLSVGETDISTNVSSMTSIQQSATQILHLLKSLSTTNAYLLPVPLNIPREHARFAILVAKGSLDYIKGGPLHSQSKQLLLDTIPILKNETRLEMPNSLTKRCASLLEYAILSILGLNLGRAAGGNSLRRRIINNESMSKVGGPRNPMPVANTDPAEQAFGNMEAMESSLRNTQDFNVPMMIDPQPESLRVRQPNPSHGMTQQYPSAGTPNMGMQGSNFGCQQPVNFRGGVPQPSNRNLAQNGFLFSPNSLSPIKQENHQQPPFDVVDETDFHVPMEETADLFRFDELIKNFGNKP
ncbi:hypothetical protein JCM33374_g2289 [Metschnikowia sp. JCM 33374]|nr:hypothetical protein JCM33374_g2289 [Metschnikowia sp. JCM 33374]